MGRPYKQDILRLAAEYRRGARSDPTSLAEALGTAGDLSLIAVGSGGALTLCELASLYHQRVFARPAWTLTPLALKTADRSISHCAVLIISARGANPDVLGALRTAVSADAKRVIVLCGRTGSPLAELASKFPQVDVIELQGRGRADGFLATGSLLSLGALLASAYTSASKRTEAMPPTLDLLLREFSGMRGLQRNLDEGVQSIWNRRYFVVLHAGTTRPAAADLESKLSETGLGAVQVVDYRNFAHGRHFWLARHADETAVVSLEADDCTEVAERTMQLIGDRVPTLRVAFQGPDLAAPLAAITAPILLAGSLGKRLDVDPGRPGVPLFGRRLYHLREPTKPTATKGALANARVAIERKTKASFAALQAAGLDTQWRKAHERFVEGLRTTRFGAIAFDYDGTLCERRNRFDPVDATVAEALLALLQGGVAIGIATGRGQSVRKALREGLPKKDWKRVLVGYYNGGQIGLLSDDDTPVASAPTGAFASAFATLKADATLTGIADLEPRSCQITVTPKNTTPSHTVWLMTMHLLHSSGLGSLAAVRSSHSTDVLAPEVSKKRLLAALEKDHGAVLSVGDSGCWPGNDFEFLANAHGLSVDEVSPDPDSCWHLGPPGSRGTACCLYYCANVVPDRRRSGFRMSLDSHTGK